MLRTRACSQREAAAGAPAATPSRPPIPGLTVIELPRAADCLVAVQQGRADAAATDDVVLAGMADQDEYLEVAPSAFDRVFGTDSATLDEPYGVALWRSTNQTPPARTMMTRQLAMKPPWPPKPGYGRSGRRNR
ncbi:transporter substrate-binding domain-containing protein [Parafrankia sp. EAN1pec]|uniref:transporter substrate-binding domain-containing protein n=1 Tax=Parafrankia sp. (strain EAN1pec) TaxID=298653 RepID=UPI0032193716